MKNADKLLQLVFLSIGSTNWDVLLENAKVNLSKQQDHWQNALFGVGSAPLRQLKLSTCVSGY